LLVQLREALLAPPVAFERTRLDREKILGGALLIIIGCLTFAPVVYVLVSSFDVSGPSESYRFGLEGWRDAFSNPKTLSSIGYSFLLSIRIPIAIAIAFPIAWLLVRVQIPGRHFIERSLWFGFFLPTIPLTMGWILLLDRHYGLLNEAAKTLPFISGPVFSIYSVPGIIWVHLTATTIPIMVILLSPALRQLDAAYEEAAETSGARLFTTLRTITIPLVAPAIFTAFIAGLIRSLEVFEIEQLLGTPANIFVYATRIYDLINWQPPLYPQAMALSTLFLGILVVVALIYQSYMMRIGNRATLSGKGLRLQPKVRPWWAYMASGVLVFYVCISIFLPLLVLVLGSLTELFGFFTSGWTFQHWKEVLTDRTFSSAAVNSIALGLLVGGLGIFLYALIAWVLVRTRIPGRSTISLLVWLPWAIPGLVLGVTLLTLMLNIPLINVLYGTLIPLVFAMIIKDMPIGVQMLRTSLHQVSPELEEAAVVAGSGFLTTFFRVTLPLMMPMLVSVFLLVFMATLRDISTIVLLASAGTRTLSLLMFEYATAGRFESAAVIGVLIALISLVFTSIAFRIGGKLGIES
jgi:iron(III) transport system permease protein